MFFKNNERRKKIDCVREFAKKKPKNVFIYSAKNKCFSLMLSLWRHERQKIFKLNNYDLASK
jgi:hypothetical protein